MMDMTETPDLQREQQTIPEAQENAETYEATVPINENNKKNILSKIIVLVKKAFSSQNRIKTIALLASILLLISTILVTSYYFSPTGVAKRYTFAMIKNDITNMAQLLAFDYYAYTLKEESEEEYFEDMSNAYKEDITSWKDLAKYQMTERKEYYEDSIGKYKIEFTLSRTKELSSRRLSEVYEEELSVFEYYPLKDADRDDITDAKVVTIKAKLNGEENLVRYTFDLVLVKIDHMWKVLLLDEQ